MKLIPLLAGFAPLLRARTLLIASLALAGGISAPASLIFYSPQGGPMEYNYLGPVAVEFTLQEATRIQKVSAWAVGWDEDDHPSTISIRYGLPAVFPDYSAVYSSPYHLAPVDDAPAAWQAISSLKWDLQPGTYWLVFDGFGSYPLGYGYYGPHPEVADSTAEIIGHATRWGLESPWENLGYPFGLKVYAVPLSAVPEPATFGIFAAFGLGVVAWWRRSFSRKIA